MPVLADCSSCGSKLNVPDDLVGREVRCPRCGTVTVVTATALPARPAPTLRRLKAVDDDKDRRYSCRIGPWLSVKRSDFSDAT